jgi:iron-sulfur cluster assembly protein
MESVSKEARALPIGIELTEAAAARLRKHLAAKGPGAGVRIGLRKSGCAGYSYTMQVAEAPSQEETVVESRGVRIFLSTAYARWLDGLRIDYGRSGVNETFRFQNPNAKALCGCGESFSI